SSARSSSRTTLSPSLLNACPCHERAARPYPNHPAHRKAYSFDREPEHLRLPRASPGDEDADQESDRDSLQKEGRCCEYDERSRQVAPGAHCIRRPHVRLEEGL